MIKKNEEYIVKIVDNGFHGEGIAKIDGQVIFVPGAIKGEKIKIQILKVTSKICYAKIIEILEKSNYRSCNDCSTYSKCGGCNLRHMDYDYTIKLKKISVENTLKKILGRNVEVNEVLKMDNPYFYRNKLQYPVGVDDSGNIVMGVFAERSHRIISTVECKIQNKLSQDIANSIIEFSRKNGIDGYNEKNLTGILRHIVIRIGVKTGEVMVTLVVNSMEIPNESKLVDFLKTEFPQIKTIIKNLNNKNTNVILGQENEIIFGNGYIEDILLGKKFKMSNMSFYQVNPIQTEKLYSKAIEYAELTGNETVFDLYCGIGTIGICASDNVKMLYGIETIPEAIEDARENAKINKIENSEFFVGDVEETLPEFIKTRNIKANVVFVDPPRKGCDKTAIDTLLQIEPEKIVYVSCNPATLARDLKVFEEKYEMKKLAICDMFPWTGHVECVVMLQLKENV